MTCSNALAQLHYDYSMYTQRQVSEHKPGFEHSDRAASEPACSVTSEKQRELRLGVSLSPAPAPRARGISGDSVKPSTRAEEKAPCQIF